MYLGLWYYLRFGHEALRLDCAGQIVKIQFVEPSKLVGKNWVSNKQNPLYHLLNITDWHAQSMIKLFPKTKESKLIENFMIWIAYLQSCICAPKKEKRKRINLEFSSSSSCLAAHTHMKVNEKDYNQREPWKSRKGHEESSGGRVSYHAKCKLKTMQKALNGKVASSPLCNSSVTAGLLVVN